MADTLPVPAAIAAALDRLMGDVPMLGVAVSGGGDSMALLAMAQDRAGARGLHVATVDHGLRPDSRAEAEGVAAYCARAWLAHTILTLEPLEPGGNLPARARKARYRALTAWAHQNGLATVLLGHTQDDQAETVLLRLARGSGVEGLSGMAETRQADGVRWVRPLLGTRRQVLRDWLRGRGIGWVDDPTNDDLAYDRIKARKALEALGPLGLTVEGLSETADRLRRQRGVLERAAEDLADAALQWGALGEAVLDPAALSAAPRDSALRVFAEVLRRIGNADYRPRFRALEPAFDQALAGGTAATLAGCVIVPGAAGIVICREPSATRPVVLAGDMAVWDGRWRIGGPCRALTVGALGEAGVQAIAARSAGWQGVPRPVRRAVPAFRCAITGALVAVPAAGYADTELCAGAAHLTTTLMNPPAAILRP